MRAAIVPWVPDDQCTACKACSSKFTIFRRRHHCRRCGFVFCSKCCNRRTTAPGYTTVQRCCQDCITDRFATIARKNGGSAQAERESDSVAGTSVGPDQARRDTLDRMSANMSDDDDEDDVLSCPPIGNDSLAAASSQVRLRSRGSAIALPVLNVTLQSLDQKIPLQVSVLSDQDTVASLMMRLAGDLWNLVYGIRKRKTSDSFDSFQRSISCITEGGATVRANVPLVQLVHERHTIVLLSSQSMNSYHSENQSPAMSPAPQSGNLSCLSFHSQGGNGSSYYGKLVSAPLPDAEIFDD